MNLSKLLTTDDAAPLCGVAAKTLHNWRYMGCGPRHIRAGRMVRYDPADIDAWLNTRRVSSTSEALAS